jgi:hypothetical protein
MRNNMRSPGVDRTRAEQATDNGENQLILAQFARTGD